MRRQIALRDERRRSRTRPMFIISLLSFPMNVFGNWVFMYGRFGMPRLGGVVAASRARSSSG